MISRRNLRVALLAGASIAIAGAASAQTAPTPAADSTVSEVVVVGSQIQGAKKTEALPVTVVGEEEIVATGAVSGDELFRSIPQAGDVQFQEARTTGNLNDARGDTSSINLRNLGTGNTLVLLNGRRVVPAPGTQTENFVPVQTANTNMFPVTGVKRIEVLRDGAAAIYGTDAVAGVVNTVLDTRYQGLRAEAQYGGSEGTDYREGVFNIKAGTRLKDGTRLTVFGGYTNHTKMLATERDYSASEDHRAAIANTPWAGDTSFDNRSTSSPWGAFTVVPSSTVVRQGTTALTSSGLFHVEPTSNTAAGCSSAVYNGNLCLKSGSITGTADRVLRYNENNDRTLKGDLKRYNAFGTVEHDFGDIEAFGEAGYYHALFTGWREQSAPISSAVITIPATNYWNPFGPTTFNGVANPNRLPNLTGVPTTGLALTITNYRPTDTGPRTYAVTDDSYRLLGGLRGDKYGFHWESALVYSWARTDDETRNAISNTLFQQALAKSTPDAYNPFNGGNQQVLDGPDTVPSSPASIQSFLINVHRISETSLTTADFKISRPDLYRLPGGDLGMAAGVEFRRETYVDDRDSRLDGTIKYTDMVTGITYGTDVMGASPSPDVDAHRTISSAYAELAVPVVSPEMGIPLIKSIDLQLAARDEYYSDFGNVLKPKLAADWKINNWIALRGSVSQGFRAPNLPQFYSAGTQVSNTRTDYSFCRLNGTTCSGASTIEVRSGNQNLKPEEADNASAGLVFTPTFIPDEFGRFTATVDFWSIREKNVIGIEGGQIQLLYDYYLRLHGQINPNIVRQAPTGTNTVGQVSYVNDNYFNLTPRQLAGLDFEIDWSLRHSPLGRFDVSLNAAKLTKFDQQADDVTATLIAANAAGQLGTGITITSAGSQIRQAGDPEWRASATMTWRGGPWRAGVFVNYVGSVNDTGTSTVNGQFWRISSWTTASVYGQYDFKGKGWGIAQGSSIRVGVRNIADKDPPLASNNFGYYGQLENSTGRYIYTTISKTFF